MPRGTKFVLLEAGSPVRVYQKLTQIYGAKTNRLSSIYYHANYECELANLGAVYGDCLWR